MSTRQFGQPVKRNEDARLLAGRAQFIDDVSLPGMLHAAFLRSPYAHARLKSIDEKLDGGASGLTKKERLGHLLEKV